MRCPIGTRTHELMAYSGAALRCVCPLLCPPTTRDGPNGHIVDPTLRINGFHGFRKARHRVSIANGPNFDMGEPARYQQNRTSIAEDFARMVRAAGSSAWKSAKNNGAVPKRRRPHSYWICHRICALGPAGNSGNPHRKCDSRFPPGIPVLSRSPVPTSPAAEYGPVHCSRLADAAAYAGSARGALNPSFSKRSAIFCAMAWPWPLSTSAMMEPPKPPPVIRAP